MNSSTPKRTDLLSSLSSALELYGNLPLTEKYLAQHPVSDLEVLLHEARQPSFRRYMSEETRPIYLLPALKSVLQERRRLLWVMMGGDTNHLAWVALTAHLNVDHQPFPLKVMVGGPHHGDRDDPALYVLSLLGRDEIDQQLDPDTRRRLRRWVQSLDTAVQKRIAWPPNDLPFEALVRQLVYAGLSPSLEARWREVTPRYMHILRLFDSTAPTDLPLDEEWFVAQSPEGHDLLQRIRARYLVKATNHDADFRHLDPANFDLLRHAFSEVLGEQVVEVGRPGVRGATVEGLNILLGPTQIGQLLDEKTLFWENGIWTGRTWIALAFAVNAFKPASDWKFGVHTSYPFVSRIADLVNLQTSPSQEGVEDVQGLGKYLRISSPQSYNLMTYEKWLRRQEARLRHADAWPHPADVGEHGRLIERILDLTHCRNVHGSLRRIPPELLLRLYVRETDRRHPSDDNITFKHCLHILYFDQLRKTSYRSIYFPLQALFEQFKRLEHDPQSASLFVRLTQLDHRVRTQEEMLIVRSWLHHRRSASRQVGAGIHALQRHADSVQQYLRDELPFVQLVADVVPDVVPVDVRECLDATPWESPDRYVRVADG